MAAPTFDSSSVGSMGGGSLTSAHTIAASGNNRILVAFFFGASGANADTKFSSVQYNSVAGTSLTSDIEINEFSNYFSLQSYYWLEANLPGSSGSYNITASTTGSMWNGAVLATSWTAANQSAPTDIGKNSSLTGTPSSSTVTISVSSADEVVLDSAFGWGTATLGASTPTAGQTEPTNSQTNGGGASYRFSQAYEVTGAGSPSQTWSFSTTCNLYMAEAVGVLGIASGTVQDAPFFGANF